MEGKEMVLYEGREEAAKIEFQVKITESGAVIAGMVIYVMGYCIRPFRATQDTSATRRFPVRPDGAYFTIMTGDVRYIIPLITRRLAKTKKNNFTRCVFLPAFVVFQQRNSPPKTLTLLSGG